MKYSEKLRDPRWQKKRLEILSRDIWKCQLCGDSKNTLHVHHRRYLSKIDPWEYPDSLLVSLCEECHEIERAERSSYEDDLLEILKEKFFAPDLFDLLHGFYELELQGKSSIVSGAIENALKKPEIQEYLIKIYLESKKGGFDI